MGLRLAQEEQKLIILYFLHKASHPLSAEQLWSFLTDKGWMHYFDFQAFVGEMTENGLILPKSQPGIVALCISSMGLDSLLHFKKRIPFSIRTEIDVYLSENGLELQRELEIRADYSQDSELDFPATLDIVEAEQTLFHLTLTLHSSAEAQRVCEAFRREAPRLYGWLVGELVRDREE